MTWQTRSRSGSEYKTNGFALFNPLDLELHSKLGAALASGAKTDADNPTGT